MFYKPTREDGLSQSEMDMARKGFRGLLLKLRYSPQFIVNNCDELLATAHSEYVRYVVEKGVEIEDPVAWTIHCAWRRTQNLLIAQNYRPQMVSSEKLIELADEGAPTPEQIAEDEERAGKVRRAVAQLDEEQRQLVALTYFEEMSVREAARYLKWHPSKAQRCHASALKCLHKALGVKSSDQLQVEVGLIAWLSVAGAGSAFHLPAGFEAALEKAGHGATGLWARAHDLARRFHLGGGSDAAGAVTSSGAGRAAGVCASAVAVACFAGAAGVVGPGVGGGIGLLGGHDQPQRVKAAGHASSTSAPATTSSAQPETSASVTAASESPATPSGNASSQQSSPKKREGHQVKEQTDGFARAASESTPSEVSASPSASASSVVPSTASSSGVGTSAEAAQAKQQFGAFK